VIDGQIELLFSFESLSPELFRQIRGESCKYLILSLLDISKAVIDPVNSDGIVALEGQIGADEKILPIDLSVGLNRNDRLSHVH
jgi:hypothetical protein